MELMNGLVGQIIPYEDKKEVPMKVALEFLALCGGLLVYRPDKYAMK